jgi:hypothetical protein
MHLQFTIAMELPENDERYLHDCARIRKISTQRLMSRVIKTVCSEQLVLAVLDDEGIQPRQVSGEHNKSHYRSPHR